MIKIIYFIIIIWTIYKISKFISKIQIQKNTSSQQKSTQKSRMDILDADYEEVE